MITRVAVSTGITCLVACLIAIVADVGSRDLAIGVLFGCVVGNLIVETFRAVKL